MTWERIAGIAGIFFAGLLVGAWFGRELERSEVRWMRHLVDAALASLVDGDVPNARYILEQMTKGEG